MCQHACGCYRKQLEICEQIQMFRKQSYTSCSCTKDSGNTPTSSGNIPTQVLSVQFVHINNDVVHRQIVLWWIEPWDCSSSMKRHIQPFPSGELYLSRAASNSAQNKSLSSALAGCLKSAGGITHVCKSYASPSHSGIHLEHHQVVEKTCSSNTVWSRKWTFTIHQPSLHRAGMQGGKQISKTRKPEKICTKQSSVSNSQSSDWAASREGVNHKNAVC